MDYYQKQIHIAKDGFDIQTSLESYVSYYKKIGWEYVNLAPTLPGIVNNQVNESIMAEFTAKQLNLI